MPNYDELLRQVDDGENPNAGRWEQAATERAEAERRRREDALQECIAANEGFGTIRPVVVSNTSARGFGFDGE
jgi:hypothetical protein